MTDSGLPIKVLELAPAGTFSGFEKTFFNSIRDQGVQVEPHSVDSRLMKAIATAQAVRWPKSSWALKRDLLYHTTPNAFNKKSRIAAKIVEARADWLDVVYQVGGLWNPLRNTQTPLILQLDYTSQLSNRRHSEWERAAGRCRDFWIQAEKKLFDSAAKILTTTQNARRASLIDDYGVEPSKITKSGRGGQSPIRPIGT